MDWDIEVDMLCSGVGIGGLASAIVSVDAGSDVLVADSGDGNQRDDPAASAPSLLDVDVVDDQTYQYFQAISDGLIFEPQGGAPVVNVPSGVIDDLSPMPSRPRKVAPFFGSRLRDWAQSCVASPSGFLYSRVADRKVVTMRSSRGESFEIAPIGPIELGPGQSQLVLTDWLSAQARDRGIEVCKRSPLQRLVFEEGQVLGAVLDTPSGACAVRARHGVLVTTGCTDLGSTVRCDFPDTATLQVSVVRQAPSRFGRIALLTTQPQNGVPHTDCRPRTKRLTDLARETWQSRSPHWRCGELHWYPPLGK